MENLFNMKVTIITPVLNGRAHLRETILSVISQTYGNIEFLVFDGGSTDGTHEIIQEFQEFITIVRIERDRSMYDAINKAIELSSGDIIGILNSDDYYNSHDIIERVVHTFLSNEKLDFVHGSVNVVDKDGKVTGFSKPVANRDLLSRINFEMPILHPTLFVRRIVYSNLGPFNLAYRIVADYEFVYRLLNSGFKGLELNFTLTNYRLGGMSGGLGGVRETLRFQKEIGVNAAHRYYIFFITLLKMFTISKLPYWFLRLIMKDNGRHQLSNKI
jgi:glycosyltransferase involved in cell wall biosynthesis